MWIFVPNLPSTSCPSAPGSAGLSSASCSPSTDWADRAAASLTWRGKPQPPQAWSRRWKAGGFIRLLSGLTCEPSTLDRGVALFISSLRETPVRTTALPESAPGPMASGFLPPRSAALPPSAGLILCSGRTSRGTRTDRSGPSSQHWKGWAIALRQEYSRRPRPATPCGASDCSSWPSASDVSTRGGSQAPEKRRAGGHAVNLEDVAENWAAPQARDHFPPHSPERIAAMKAEGHGMRNLNDEAASWSSPKASDPEKAGPNMRGSKGDVPLPGQAANWPGPDANVMNDGEEPASWKARAARLKEKHGNGNGAGMPLAVASVDWMNHCLPPSFPAQPTAAGSTCSTGSPNSNQPSAKRKLNPIFVEALMRWPTGLSGFARQETAWTQWWQLQRSYLSALDWGSSAMSDDLFGGG